MSNVSEQVYQVPKEPLTYATSSSRDANGKSDLRREVCGENRHTRDEETTKAEPDAECLSQKNLPVCSGDTQHHVSKDDKERSCQYQRTKAARIVDWSSQSADQHEEEALNGAYP